MIGERRRFCLFCFLRVRFLSFLRPGCKHTALFLTRANSLLVSFPWRLLVRAPCAQDGRLAVMLLREVGGVDPSHYKRQQERDAAGVRNVAAFLCDVSAALPKLVATNIRFSKLPPALTSSLLAPALEALDGTLYILLNR